MMLRMKQVLQDQKRTFLAQNAARAKRKQQIKECDLQTSQQRILLIRVSNSYSAADQSNEILSSRVTASHREQIAIPDIDKAFVPNSSQADGLREREFIKATIELQLKIVKLTEEFHTLSVADQTKHNQFTIDCNGTKLTELIEQTARAEINCQEEQIEFAKALEALKAVEPQLGEDIAADTKILAQIEAKIAATELYDGEQLAGERREAAIIEGLEARVAELEALMKIVRGKRKDKQ